MISYDEVLSLNYYKKASFTGWTGGMRFLIRRETPENSDSIFHAFVWPGPYIFDLVDNDLKFDATFPFSEDGKIRVVDWLNQQYTEKSDLWPKNKVAGVW